MNKSGKCRHQWVAPEVGHDGIECSECGRWMGFIDDFATAPYKAHSIIESVMNNRVKEEAEVFVVSFGRAYENARARFEASATRSYPSIPVEKFQKELAKRTANRTGVLGRMDQWIAAMKRDDLAEAYRIAHQPIPRGVPKYERRVWDGMQDISRAVGTGRKGL